MVIHTNLSESEEMYLVSIARLIESGIDGPVPLSQLAGELPQGSLGVGWAALEAARALVYNAARLLDEAKVFERDKMRAIAADRASAIAKVSAHADCGLVLRRR